jgi:hypothetical protein
MADFRIDRIRFTWKGDWTPLTAYVKDDIVRYGGKSYVCLVGHDSTDSFYAALENINTATEPDIPAPAWGLWFDGYEWKGQWTNGTYYNVGDIVEYGSIVYLCNAEHTSKSATAVLSVTGASGTGSLATITFAPQAIKPYTIGSTITVAGMLPTGYNGSQTVTACTTSSVTFANSTTGFNIGGTVSGVSQIGLEGDQAKWTAYAKTDKWMSVWTTSTRYKLNDIVKYNGIIYRCTVPHTSINTQALGLENNQGNWEVVESADKWRTDWTATTRYRANDLVKWGGRVYRCLTGHTSATYVSPTWFGLELDSINWEVVTNGIEYKSTWTYPTRYKLNDIVKYGADVWICTEAHVSSASFDTLKWSVYIPGLEYLSGWSSTTKYIPGDIVIYGGYSYCSSTHNLNSVPSNSPANWSLLSTGYNRRDDWSLAATYRVGDVVRRNGQLYVANTDSTAVETTDTNYWTLVVPGEMWFNVWATGTTYLIGDIVRANVTTYRCLTKHVSSPLNKPTNATAGVLWEIYLPGDQLEVVQERGDMTTWGDTAPQAVNIGTAGNVFKSNGTLPLWGGFGEVGKVYYVAGNGVDGAGYGLTLNAPFKTIRYACSVVTGPATIFIKTGSYYETLPISIPADVALVGDELRSTTVLPATTILTTATASSASTNKFTVTSTSGMADGTAVQFNGTMGGVILGTTYYVIGSSITGTQFSISNSPGGTVRNLTDGTGSVPVFGGDAVKNMFYVRNGTGIRNMTLKGLTGFLGTANAYLTKRPTAGAYVSLDPGTGPSDTTVWISSRSPYVQNVTTFGTACVGLKIDGTLHNGGNRSVVANDFTQVLSDGIGAWCTGSSALTELVSVFSYYGHIGYLAEAGGKIRATNGNSSYGTYGTVAEGYDATESPLLATVNHQAYQTQVYSVFAGQAQNKMLVLEYSNCGQSYSSATYSFSGAGTGASAIAEDFRDNAIYEVRMTGTNLQAGGFGYLTSGNQTVTGDTTSITFVSNDSNTSANYTGMRVVLNSGVGVGQYGYIQAYNATTKVATIAKESFTALTVTQSFSANNTFAVANTSSLYVGMPIKFTGTKIGGASVTTTDTFYVIAANFSSSNFSVSTTPSGSAITLTDQLASTMSLVALGWDHVVPGTAIANLLDTSTVYSVEARVIFPAPTYTTSTKVLPSISSWATAAYGNGTFTMLGASGASAYTNDGSTWQAGLGLGTDNYTSVAYGNSAFVAVPSGSANAAFSANGASWSIGSLPSSANWSSVAYGNGKFMAVSTGGSTAAAISSSNGSGWSAITLPASASWTGVAYSGAGIWVAITGSNSNVAAYSTNDGSSWTTTTLPATANWVKVKYGSGMFVAIAAGTQTAAYSLDGITWTSSTMLVSATWSDLSYGQGVFFAVASATNNAATSEDGINWTLRTMPSVNTWSVIAMGKPVSGGGCAIAAAGNTSVASLLQVGCTARGRAVIASYQIGLIKMWNPGSGYITTPTVTIYDPNPTLTGGTPAVPLARIGTGVMAQPTWANRGIGYQTSTTTCTVSGNGAADIYPSGKYLNVSGLNVAPGPGSNLLISGDSTQYKIVTATGLSPSVYRLQISPSLDNLTSPDHNTGIIIRQKYSQVRLTGHDYLLIGTGNAVDTNYPNVDTNTAAGFKQVQEHNGGRVFYTSTDQDGNFRVGGLFAVQQATGTVTVSADLFNLNGLNSLTLGGVQIGVNTVTVTQFSTDQYFTANSDAIVPTQRAIKSYLSRNIASGGSDASTNSLVSGQIGITANAMRNTAGGAVKMKNKVSFKKGVDGGILASTYFAHSFSS